MRRKFGNCGTKERGMGLNRRDWKIAKRDNKKNYIFMSGLKIDMDRKHVDK